MGPDGALSKDRFPVFIGGLIDGVHEKILLGLFAKPSCMLRKRYPTSQAFWPRTHRTPSKSFIVKIGGSRQWAVGSGHFFRPIYRENAAAPG